MMSAFFSKKIVSFYSKQKFRSCVSDFLVLFSVFVRYKVTFNEKNVLQTMRLESGFRIPPNWPKTRKNENDVTIFRHVVIINFFWCFLFLLSILFTGRSFMSISSLVLELWQLSSIRDWPEIQKWKYLCLSFSQYLETWASYGH